MISKFKFVRLLLQTLQHLNSEVADNRLDSMAYIKFVIFAQTDTNVYLKAAEKVVSVIGFSWCNDASIMDLLI